ncbi:MAG: hypothetical protein QF790_00730, partial [Gammaproteobacteria bacterium]|nr:hypothetical protein [Gammaproteobacteria bacterium]
KGALRRLYCLPNFNDMLQESALNDEQLSGLAQQVMKDLLRIYVANALHWATSFVYTYAFYLWLVRGYLRIPQILRNRFQLLAFQAFFCRPEACRHLKPPLQPHLKLNTTVLLPASPPQPAT